MDLKHGYGMVDIHIIIEYNIFIPKYACTLDFFLHDCVCILYEYV